MSLHIFTQLLCYAILMEVGFRTASLERIFSDEHKLLRHLFADQDPFLPFALPRDKKRNSTPLIIHHKFRIYNINDVRATEEELDLAAWTIMKWRNDFLRWNTSEYNVPLLHIPSRLVWTPRLFMMESITGNIFQLPPNSTLFLEPDGTTTLDLSHRLILRCSMKACFFPVDTHYCNVGFYIVGYSKEEALLASNFQLYREPPEVNETGTWSVKISDVKEGIDRMPHINVTTSYVVYTMTLTRKPAIFTVTVIMPVIILTSVVFASVLLPPNSGERVSLLVTCLLAQVVYLDTIFNSLPRSSDYTPVFVCWLLMVLVFICLQIWFSCLVSNFSDQGQRGKGLNKRAKFLIFDVLAKCLTMHCRQKSKIDNTEHGRLQQDIMEVDTNAIDSPIPEIKQPGDQTPSKDPQLESETKEVNVSCYKECRRAVMILDRFSMVLSALVIGASAIVIGLIYTENGGVLCF